MYMQHYNHAFFQPLKELFSLCGQILQHRLCLVSIAVYSWFVKGCFGHWELEIGHSRFRNMELTVIDLLEWPLPMPQKTSIESAIYRSSPAYWPRLSFLPHCLGKGWLESSRWISVGDFTAHVRVQVGPSTEHLGTRLEAPVIRYPWGREKCWSLELAAFRNDLYACVKITTNARDRWPVPLTEAWTAHILALSLL